jgi:AcrR family transcriptional regulator
MMATADADPRRREATRDRRPPDLQRIRRALFDLCAEVGYPRVDVPMLLERAGVSRRAFFDRFSSLEDCLCTVVEDERADLLRRSWNAFTEQSSWPSAIRAIAHTLLRFFEEDLPRARVMVVEMDSAGERARLIRDEGIEAFVTFIDMGRSELEDPESISRATAEAIAGSIFTQFRNAIEYGDPASRAALLPQLMYAVVLPYKGPQAAMTELKALPPVLRAEV